MLTRNSFNGGGATTSLGGSGNTYTATSGPNDHLFNVIVHIQNTQGGWTPVKCVSDSGNEISIFKREVADELGLDLSGGQDFDVSGINGPRHKFKKFKLFVKIGTLQPTQITIGFAVNRGDLAENLLGNKDVVKSGKFDVKYSGNSVTYTQRAFMGKVSTCDDPSGAQADFNMTYDQLTTLLKPFEKKECKCKNCQDDKKKKGDGGDKKGSKSNFASIYWDGGYEPMGYGEFYC